MDLCVFDENGLRFPREKYCDNPQLVSDITVRYCNTPDLYVNAGDQSDNSELHDHATGLMRQLLTDCCLDERLTDGWEEFSELMVEGNIWFKTESIPKINELLGKMTEAVRPYETVDLCINVQAIPDGENDYDFAAVKFTLEDGCVRFGCCRF